MAAFRSAARRAAEWHTPGDASSDAAKHAFDACQDRRPPAARRRRRSFLHAKR